MAYSDVIAQLRGARVARAMPQEELARTLGVSQSQLSRYEQGSHACSAAVLVQWAGALGLSVELAPAGEVCAS